MWGGTLSHGERVSFGRTDYFERREHENPSPCATRKIGNRIIRANKEQGYPLKVSTIRKFWDKVRKEQKGTGSNLDSC